MGKESGLDMSKTWHSHRWTILFFFLREGEVSSGKRQSREVHCCVRLTQIGCACGLGCPGQVCALRRGLVQNLCKQQLLPG